MVRVFGDPRHRPCTWHGSTWKTDTVYHKLGLYVNDYTKSSTILGSRLFLSTIEERPLFFKGCVNRSFHSLIIGRTVITPRLHSYTSDVVYCRGPSTSRGGDCWALCGGPYRPPSSPTAGRFCPPGALCLCQQRLLPPLAEQSPGRSIRIHPSCSADPHRHAWVSRFILPMKAPHFIDQDTVCYDFAKLFVSSRLGVSSEPFG